jgi:hypothetical protein
VVSRPNPKTLYPSTQIPTQDSRHRVDSKQEDPWRRRGVRNRVRGDELSRPNGANLSALAGKSQAQSTWIVLVNRRRIGLAGHDLMVFTSERSSCWLDKVREATMYFKFGPIVVTVAVPPESTSAIGCQTARENTSSLFLHRWSISHLGPRFGSAPCT